MYPQLLEIQLTGSCNLRCSYCGNSVQYINNYIAEPRGILKAIEELRPTKLLFTGGESYLEWELLLYILETIKNKNFDYVLSSNLTMINAFELDVLINKYGFKTFHSSFNDLDESMSYKIRKNSPKGRKQLIIVNDISKFTLI